MLAGSSSTEDHETNEVRIGAPLANGRPNFPGELTQGTPGHRFVDVNSESK
jgi:hypothetical protein